MELEHKNAPHLRALQRAIAEEVTIRVHGEQALNSAISASNILFGKSTSEDLIRLSEREFFEVFEGVPQSKISKSDFEQGIPIIDLLASKSGFLSSNGEARRELTANSISINKEKVSETDEIGINQLINGKYLLLGKGKKTNFIVVAE